MTIRTTGRARGGAMVLALVGAAACGTDLDTPVANQELLALEADYVAFGMTTYVTAKGVR